MSKLDWLELADCLLFGAKVSALASVIVWALA